MRSSPFAVVLIFICTLMAISTFPSRGAAPAPTFAVVLAQFDPALPGYDYDHAMTTQQGSQDMALAMYLVATVRAGAMVEARIAADQLVAMRKHVAAVGWGLGFAWDASRDGTTNRGDTVYGITVAVVVRGLFDFYDATGEAKYKNAALEGLEYYRATSYVGSATGDPANPSGFLWYSNQTADQGKEVVLNVSAMLMGQYARAYAYTNNGDYKDIAERCQRYIWMRRIESQIKWPYRVALGSEGSRMNDAVHAAFMVQGFLDVARYMPPLFDVTPAVNYLASLAAAMTANKQRLWGAGMMIYTLADAGRTLEANAVVANVLPRFPVTGGRYGWATDSAIAYVRHTSYLLAGLARIDAESSLRAEK